MNQITNCRYLFFVVGLSLAGCQHGHSQASHLSSAAAIDPVYLQIQTAKNPEEFSACMPAAEDGNFWVASDENKKVLWKIDTSGRFLQEINLDDKSHNDMEALAADGQGGFFVITSQSLNSSGDRKKSRSRLSHFADFTPSGGDRQTVGGFRETLLDSFVWTDEARINKPKKGGIDIEGLAYDSVHDRMWFGFRGPLLTSNQKRHALLIQLNRALEHWDPEDRNPPEKFSWDADSPVSLDLGGHGIRGLYYLGDHRLLVLSGLIGSNPVDSTPAGKLWQLNISTRKLKFIREIPQVPDQENSQSFSAPEGVCVIKDGGEDKLLIVYDSMRSGIFSMSDL